MIICMFYDLPSVEIAEVGSESNQADGESPIGCRWQRSRCNERLLIVHARLCNRNGVPQCQPGGSHVEDR